MRKILTIMALLIPLAVCADELGLKAPQWKDFAPKTFVDVQEPKMFKRLNVTAKYWYERRLAFEDELAECQTIEAYDERFTCYETLKIRQFKENTDYNARIEARQQASAGVQQMNVMNTNMVPLNNMVNGYMHFMPNEFR